MGDIPRIDSEAIVALSRAIDEAMDRGDVDEAIRLSSLQWSELSRWLEDHGYPPLDDDNNDNDALRAFAVRLRSA